MPGNSSNPPLPNKPEGKKIVDRRKQFSEKCATGASRLSEQGFLEAKLEMIRSDPTLSEEEKERTAHELQSRIDRLKMISDQQFKKE